MQIIAITSKLHFVPGLFLFKLKNFHPLGFAFSYDPTSWALSDALICYVIRGLQ